MTFQASPYSAIPAISPGIDVSDRSSLLSNQRTRCIYLLNPNLTRSGDAGSSALGEDIHEK